jgi:hypothetical protein
MYCKEKRAEAEKTSDDEGLHLEMKTWKINPNEPLPFSRVQGGELHLTTLSSNERCRNP